MVRPKKRVTFYYFETLICSDKKKNINLLKKNINFNKKREKV